MGSSSAKSARRMPSTEEAESVDRVESSMGGGVWGVRRRCRTP
jgi:hypothetical protein